MIPFQLDASHWNSGDAAHTASRTFFALKRHVIMPLVRGRAVPLASSLAVMRRITVSDLAARA